MRVLICDDHVLFAESLAHLLGALGPEVVATTFHPNQAIPELRRQSVDVCLLDVMFGAETIIDRLPDIRAASPTTRIVLLGARLDPTTVAAGRLAGVRGVADKRQPVAEIVRILERVHQGEVVIPHELVAKPAGPRPSATEASEAQRLAGFLTPRECEVLAALVCGRDTVSLARDMGITENTARCHIQAVLMKLGAHSRLEAATTAVRFGMVDPQTGQWLLSMV